MIVKQDSPFSLIYHGQGSGVSFSLSTTNPVGWINKFDNLMDCDTIYVNSSHYFSFLFIMFLGDGTPHYRRPFLFVDNIHRIA
jgi:hypothetical protein